MLDPVLADHDLDVRAHAAQTLDEIGLMSERFFSTLIACLGSSDEGTRQWSALRNA